MKRIITVAALAALTSTLSATTPTDLIRQMRGEHGSDRAATQRHIRHHADRPVHRAVHRTTPRNVHTRNKKMEKKLAHTTPRRRRFRTLKEFQNLERRQARSVRHTVRSASAHHRVLPAKLRRQNRYVGNGWYVDEHGQYDEQYSVVPTRIRHIRIRRHRQHAYRHYRRQWYLTFLYERAEFYDRHGYHYGYFNERGFVFEGVFYRYDRAYTYQDRLHGKGLFEHRFYRPRHRYAFRRRYNREDRDGFGFYFRWSL